MAKNNYGTDVVKFLKKQPDLMFPSEYVMEKLNISQSKLYQKVHVQKSKIEKHRVKGEKGVYYSIKSSK